MSRGTRTRSVALAALCATLTVASAGCGDDDAAVDTTDVTEETTTSAAAVEEPTTSGAAVEETTTSAAAVEETTTSAAAVEEPTTSGAAVGEVTVGDFEGAWQATSYVITSTDDPAVTVDVVAAGAALTATTDAAGRLTGQLEVAEALGGPLTLEFVATFVLVDQQTMTVTFEPQIPPLLTDFTGPFSFDDETMTLRDENAVFDFDDGNGEVPVTAEVTLVRS